MDRSVVSTDMDLMVDVALVPYRVVYCMEPPCMDDTLRDPPVFIIAALDMEIAGAKRLERIVKVCEWAL